MFTLLTHQMLCAPPIKCFVPHPKMVRKNKAGKIKLIRYLGFIDASRYNYIERVGTLLGLGICCFTVIRKDEDDRYIVLIVKLFQYCNNLLNIYLKLRYLFRHERKQYQLLIIIIMQHNNYN